jgi:hypothetical protein
LLLGHLTFINLKLALFCEKGGWRDTLDPTGDGMMKSLAIHAALLTAVGSVALMGTVASTVPANARCMIDEGNGRYTPCDALYKSKACMIDEGNGRYTPCSALVKQTKSKKKG